MIRRNTERGWIAPGLAMAGVLIGLVVMTGCGPTLGGPVPPSGPRPAGLYELAEDLDNIRAADGGVSLARGVLIEDDGPAFGIFDPLAQGGPDAIPGRPIRKSATDVTDTPYWEPLSKTNMARKTLLITSLPMRPLGHPAAARPKTVGQLVGSLGVSVGEAFATPKPGAAEPKPRTVDLLIYAARRPDAKLIVLVNGSRMEVPADSVPVAAPTTRPDKTVASTQPAGQVKFETPQWHRISISEAALRTGENEIVLSSDTDSPGWLLLIAPRDAYARGTAGRRTFPGRSFRSDDSGRTWQPSPKLGRAGLAAGEYAVRLWLDQHVLTGLWTGPRVDLVERVTFDLGGTGSLPASVPTGRQAARATHGVGGEGFVVATPNDTPIRQAVKFASAAGQIDQDVPAACKVEWEFRTGSVQLGVAAAWGPWTKFTPERSGSFGLDAVNNRYVQFRAKLTTENPAAAPIVRGITANGVGPAVQPTPPGQLRLTEWTNPRIVRSALDFTYETWPNPKLKLLDDKFGLAAAVKPARTQFETAILTLDWLKATMRGRNVFVPSHTWNAVDILSTQTTAPTEPLAYALVYCQALLAHGITARIFAGPACEFWSTDFGKWVMVRPDTGEYCIDVRSGLPQAGWELQGRNFNRLLDDCRRDEVRLRDRTPLRREDILAMESDRDNGLRVATPAEVLPLGSGIGFPVPVLLIPRNNFASVDRPLPLTVTEVKPGWPDLVVLEPSVQVLNEISAHAATERNLWAQRGEELFRAMGGTGKVEQPTKRAPEPAMVLSLSQLPHHIDRLCDLYPTLNTVQMEVQYGKSPGELLVYLDTETPGFETFQVNIDQAGFSSIPGASQFRWLLAPGPNSLQVRVRNKAGATGSISSIAVQYLPVAAAAKTAN